MTPLSPAGERVTGRAGPDVDAGGDGGTGVLIGKSGLLGPAGDEGAVGEKLGPNGADGPTPGPVGALGDEGAESPYEELDETLVDPESVIPDEV